MASWTHNTYKKGIEIKFNKKPLFSVIEQLKRDGWKWYPKKSIWYASYSEDNIASANRICAYSKYLDAHNSSKFLSFNEFEAQKNREEITSLRTKYKDVWEVRFEKTQYYNIQKLKVILERKREIQNINKFFLDNCTYSIEELQNMNSWDFDKFAKYGSNEDVGFDILLSKVEEDALALLKARYRLFFELQDEQYRNALIEKSRNTKVKKSICPRCGKNQPIENGMMFCNQCSEMYGLNTILKSFDMNCTTFWDYLKLFGHSYQPVNRVASKVSYGAASYGDTENNFLQESLKKLTLHTVDGVTHTIKPLLFKELNLRIAEMQNDKPKYYLCSVYFCIMNDKIQLKKYLLDFVRFITPEKIILDYIANKYSIDSVQWIHIN